MPLFVIVVLPRIPQVDCSHSIPSSALLLTSTGPAQLLNQTSEPTLAHSPLLPLLLKAPPRPITATSDIFCTRKPFRVLLLAVQASRSTAVLSLTVMPSIGEFVTCRPYRKTFCELLIESAPLRVAVCPDSAPRFRPIIPSTLTVSVQVPVTKMVEPTVAACCNAAFMLGY